MEIWVKIKNYENYEVSNLGTIRSLKFGKVKNLKPILSSNGYLMINLYNNKKGKRIYIHQIVAIAFLNHSPCGKSLVVNHKNFNRTDNRVENLEVITQRENTNKKHLNSTSKYTGVSWHKKNKHWYARIIINGKKVYLGCFKNEYDAHLAYENKLKEISQAINLG